MRSYRSKRMFFLDMYQVHLRNAVKVIDFSSMILEVYVRYFGHVSTNKENTENKSDERNGKKRKKRTFCMNKNGTVNVDIKFTIKMKPNVFQWHNNTNNALATMEMPI